MGQVVQITEKLAVDVDRILSVHMYREGRTVVEYVDSDGETHVAQATLPDDDVLRALALIERKRE
jgi:hypothetical protein